jgi:hypothetical protein
MILLQFEIFVKLFSRRVLPCAPHSNRGRSGNNLMQPAASQSVLARAAHDKLCHTTP